MPVGRIQYTLPAIFVHIGGTWNITYQKDSDDIVRLSLSMFWILVSKISFCFFCANTPYKHSEGFWNHTLLSSILVKDTTYGSRQSSCVAKFLSLAYCFFQALDGLRHILSSVTKAHTPSRQFDPHISGLFCLHPYVWFSVSSLLSGALKATLHILNHSCSVENDLIKSNTTCFSLRCTYSVIQSKSIIPFWETEYTQMLIDCIKSRVLSLKSPSSRNFDLSKSIRYLFYGSGVISTLYKINQLWGDSGLSTLFDLINEYLVNWEPNDDCRYWLLKNTSDYKKNYPNFDSFLRKNLSQTL